MIVKETALSGSAGRCIPRSWLVGLVVITMLAGGLTAWADHVVVAADSFANLGDDREQGDPLDGVLTELGGLEWQAKAGVGFGLGQLTNLNTLSSQRAGVPVGLENHPEAAVITIGVDLQVSGTDWVAVSFATSPTNAGEQLLMTLSPYGSVNIWADGLTHQLYSSSGVEPAFLAAQPNRLELAYNRVDSTVAAWLNGSPLSLTISDLDDVSFVPQPLYACFKAKKDPAFAATGVVAVDSFQLTVDDSVTPLQLLTGPTDQEAATGGTAVLACDATGGAGSRSIQWQLTTSKLEEPSWVDLSDGGSISGATSDTLWLRGLSTADVGYYRCRVRDSAAIPSELSSPPAMLSIDTPLLAELFTNAVPDREIGDPLNGLAVEVGDPGITWTATTGTVLADSVLGNDTGACARAGLPFVPGNHLGFRSDQVEAVLDASQSQWIGIGFADAAAGALWNTGQVWMMLRSDGRASVFADGTTHNLYADAVANPAAQSGLNHLRLAYDRVDGTVRAWLNGRELSVDSSYISSFTPDIQYVSWNGYLTGCYTAADQLWLDDVAVSLGEPVETLQVAALPAERYAELGADLSQHCPVSGGITPYTLQWQASTDGSSFNDLSDGGRISGSTTADLSITAVEAGDAQYYRCQADDSDSPPSSVTSSASQLVIVPSTPATGCTALDPAPADFSTAAGVAEWTPSHQPWSYAAGPPAGADLFTGSSPIDDVYLSIHRDEVLLPVAATRLEIDFAQLSAGISLRLVWGDDPGQRATIALPQPAPNTQAVAELELSELAGWHDDTAIDGYYLRDLRLEMLTADISGRLAAIRLYPGPDLSFETPPELHTSDGAVPHTYGAGTVMSLHQQLRNTGCDFGDGPYSQLEQRRITYTLCKAGGSPCFDERITCYSGAGVPTNVATAIGELAAGLPETHQLCTVTLPEAGEDDVNLGDWELTGTFVTDPAETTSFSFTLVATGVPNFVVDHLYTVETPLPGGGTRDFVHEGLVFDLDVGLYSQEYPWDQVPVLISARSHLPGEVVPETWIPIFSGYAATIPVTTGGVGVTFNNLLVPLDDVLPASRDWALLDLKIEIDPANLIPEITDLYPTPNDTDNRLYLDSWIVIVDRYRTDLSDAIGTPLALGTSLDPELDFELDDGQCSEAMAHTGGLACQVAPSGDLLHLQADANSAAGDRAVFDVAETDSQIGIGGAMVRYLRTDEGFSPGSGTAAGWEIYDGDDPFTPSAATIGETTPLAEQWRVYVWRSGSGSLFADLNVPELGRGTDATGQLGDRRLALEIDIDRGHSTTFYPFHCFDTIKAWPVQLESLVLEGFRYSTDGGASWTAIDPAAWPQVEVGTQVRLQAEVVNGGEDLDHTTTLNVSGSLTYADGVTVESLSGQEADVLLDAGASVWVDLGSITIQGIPGLADLHADLTATYGNVGDPSADAGLEVVTDLNCTSILVFPTNLSGAR